MALGRRAAGARAPVAGLKRRRGAMYRGSTLGPTGDKLSNQIPNIDARFAPRVIALDVRESKKTT